VNLSRRRRSWLCLLAALVVALAGCRSSVYRTYDYKKEFDPRQHEYIIGVGDALAISVYRNPEMSGNALVRPDGIITLPLIGDLAVAGKTPSQVRDEMRKKVAAYVKDDTAVITVAVTGANSYRFVVAGNVGHAGSFTQRYYVTVSEAIAMAGGPNRFAGDEIVILRPDPSGRVREIPVNYADITSGRYPEQDIAIVSGDTVFVP
jgi:polysaccharide biosynthesis/export protein